LTIKKPLAANLIVAELKKCGVTHLVWVPDTESQVICQAAMEQPDFTLVPVCREGEAIPIAIGLTLGGKVPVVVHQNTGFFESGDSVRALAIDLGLPLLLIIGYRGWRRQSPLTDSAAIYTEPILKAWGLKYHLVESDDDVEKISLGFKEAQANRRAVVILIGREFELD
jgi:sulfopyruvate decarboxylase subunit alpha